MKNSGYDVSGIDESDKLGRNIIIGQMMRDNPKLTSLLRNTTESIINDYINKNKIKDYEIVIRQYDGLLLTRTLEHTNIGHIPLERRKTFQIFLSSIDRKKYIALDNNLEVEIKGIPYRYEQMDNIYKRLCKSLDMNRESLYRNLKNIKDEILTSNNNMLYGIPTKTGKYTVFLKGYGELEITSSTLKILDSDDIDKKKYFEFYIEPFTKSIVIETVR